MYQQKIRTKYLACRDVPDGRRIWDSPSEKEEAPFRDGREERDREVFVSCVVVCDQLGLACIWCKSFRVIVQLSRNAARRFIQIQAESGKLVDAPTRGGGHRRRYIYYWSFVREPGDKYIVSTFGLCPKTKERQPAERKASSNVDDQRTRRLKALLATSRVIHPGVKPVYSTVVAFVRDTHLRCV